MIKLVTRWRLLSEKSAMIAVMKGWVLSNLVNVLFSLYREDYFEILSFGIKSLGCCLGIIVLIRGCSKPIG